MITADSVVENGSRHFGRFARTPREANPADEFRGVRRLFEDWRTKEWAGFTLGHPELFSSMIVQDAKYLASSEMYVFDRATGSLSQWAGSMSPRRLTLPADILRSRVRFADEKKGHRIGYDFADERIVITIEIAAQAEGPAVTGRLELDPSRASAPLVVSSRLPGGGRMYTNKIVFPASGSLRVGGREYAFDPARDFAILDEHKSHLPYRTRWVWGTFALPHDGGFLGANFAHRPHTPGEEEESAIWTPTGVEPLSDITFTPQGEDRLSPWRIRSADGRLDVTFSPQGRKDVNVNFVVAALRYFQMYGTYTGTVNGIDIGTVGGVCEDFAARL
ncbi:DUF2804 family protein [Microbacterium sp. NPDC096154]|uniref:DUF2804 family protein n=1 Tax=Microbacterium sp. NPDC096154 TaxID=3155549 RepID=UPI00331B76C6